MKNLRTFSINCRGRLLDLTIPKIMGILNLTPDSFSDGGLFNSEITALKQTEKMISEGAKIIDIGGQSTNPKADFITDNEEINRIKKILPAVRKEFSEIIISLDTFHSQVVNFGYNEGIDIINDISGGQFDKKMLLTVAKTELPYILTHCNPDYNQMHDKIKYEDIILELNRFFSKKTAELLHLGIKDIILDPGFGFGKTIDNQHQIVEELEHIAFGEMPLLVGISRKSFIYKPLDKKPNEINEETQKLHLKMLEKGAKILRVHDVAGAQKTVDYFLEK